MIASWKDVINYELIYEVSSLGQIRNKKTGLILKQHHDKDGYLRLEIQDKGRRHKCNVARIVLSAFSGIPAKGIQSNHINGIRDDNRLENLEWVTPLENIRHSWEKLNRKMPNGESHYSTGLTEKDVIYIREKFANSPRGIGNILAAQFNVTRATITDICKYRSWKHI